LAICPKGAISILGFDPENSMPISADNMPHMEDVARLMRGRRSVRQYRDENVDPHLIRELLATIAYAPTGRNSRSLTFTVIDEKETLNWLRIQTMQRLQKKAEAGLLPENLAFLRNVVSNYFANKGDGIFRGAPHMLFVSTLPNTPCPMEDVTIALSYFELLAQSAGLGTVWCGLIKWTLELIPELKALLELQEGHPYYAMLFGYPAVSYARTVQRDNSATIKQIHIAGSI
jgi:nitroreductase